MEVYLHRQGICVYTSFGFLNIDQQCNLNNVKIFSFSVPSYSQISIQLFVNFVQHLAHRDFPARPLACIHECISRALWGCENNFVHLIMCRFERVKCKLLTTYLENQIHNHLTECKFIISICTSGDTFKFSH